MNKNKQAIIFCISVFLIALMACSCSSSKKSQQTTQSTHDSVATATKSNAAVKTVDSTSIKKNNIIRNGSTVIELAELDDDYGRADYFAQIKNDSTSEKDYAPVKKPAKNIIHLPGGGKIETNQPIRSITSGLFTIDTSYQLVHLNKKDTAGASETKNVQVHDSSESTKSTVRKTNWNALIFSSVLIFLIILAVRKFLKK